MPNNPRRRGKRPQLPVLKQVPPNYSFLRGEGEPRLKHQLLGPGETPRYRGQVLPMTTAQRRTLEELGVKLYGTGITIWPADLAAREKAREAGKKRIPTRKTTGFDRAERYAAHQIEGSELTRSRVIQVAPLLAGVIQYVIENEMKEPAQRLQVAQNLQVLGLMLGKSSRGSLREARHAMRDAIGFLLAGNTSVAVLKMFKAHNDLAERLTTSNRILPRTEVKHEEVAERNASRRAGYRKWMRELGEDIELIRTMRIRPDLLSQIANRHLRQSRGYGRIATQQVMKGIQQGENRNLATRLQQISTLVRQMRDHPAQQRELFPRLEATIHSAQQWGTVRYARHFSISNDVFRSLPKWGAAERKALLNAQIEWAANNIDHWAKGGNAERILPWMERGLEAAVKEDPRYSTVVRAVIASRKWVARRDYARAVRVLEAILPNLPK